jgi:hypothetical protein
MYCTLDVFSIYKPRNIFLQLQEVQQIQVRINNPWIKQLYRVDNDFTYILYSIVIVKVRGNPTLYTWVKSRLFRRLDF